MGDAPKDLDVTIFPEAEFRGQWNYNDPPEWENFSICLFGQEAGDFIVDPPEVHEALEASGYRLTLTKSDVDTQYTRTDQLTALAGHWSKEADEYTQVANQQQSDRMAAITRARSVMLQGCAAELRRIIEGEG